MVWKRIGYKAIFLNTLAEDKTHNLKKIIAIHIQRVISQVTSKLMNRLITYVLFKIRIIRWIFLSVSGTLFVQWCLFILNIISFLITSLVTMLWLVLNYRGIACLVEVFTFNRYSFTGFNMNTRSNAVALLYAPACAYLNNKACFLANWTKLITITFMQEHNEQLFIVKC